MMSQLHSSITFKRTHPLTTPKFTSLKRNNVTFNTITFSITLPSLSVKCHSSQLIQPKPFPSPPQQRSPVGELQRKFYVGYSIYTRKGVLTVSPRPPEFETKDSGAFKVSREGYLLLQFAPSDGTDGDRPQYDWSRKQIFSLSVSEMGTIIGLGARDSCELFHDSFKQKSEVEVRKVLKVEPLPDATGHLFNLRVENQNKPENMDETQESIYIPVASAELAVFRSIFNYIMPYLLGWHAFANSIKPEVFSRANTANPRFAADYEWDR
ncbi:single-stranded DNA-binding protein WHY1, chloroplastic-like [Abrus precatorius]|uniref:Single-stranded DNA-binding protein WHY1, chloroplastic-like n=1 Tax=Abrus precatorius TaxID=3816 RepID=A0A8B8LXF5_ABRPR|nr:single-stranded DNA-binding protein WHY1, chloroplastic-like [Abrus precatorius]